MNNSLTTILKDNSENIWMAPDYGNDVGDTAGIVWCYKRSLENGKDTLERLQRKKFSYALGQRKQHLAWNERYRLIWLRRKTP